MGWKLTRKGWEKTSRGGEPLLLGGQRADYYASPPPPGQWRDAEGRPLKSDGTLDVEKFIAEQEERNRSR
jgi:hypothetical protein